MTKRIIWRNALGGELCTKKVRDAEEARLKRQGKTVRTTRKKTESTAFGAALYLIEYH
jgi:hypothetical protein